MKTCRLGDMVGRWFRSIFPKREHILWHAGYWLSRCFRSRTPLNELEDAHTHTLSSLLLKPYARMTSNKTPENNSFLQASLKMHVKTVLDLSPSSGKPNTSPQYITRWLKPVRRATYVLGQSHGPFQMLWYWNTGTQLTSIVKSHPGGREVIVSDRGGGGEEEDLGQDEGNRLFNWAGYVCGKWQRPRLTRGQVLRLSAHTGGCLQTY